MSLPSAYELEKVKEVCKLLESSPELIHEPQLDFFRHFIHSFTVPPPPPAIEELSDAEEDDPEVVPPDEIEASQEMGDAAFEPTDAQLEQASEAKMAASEALAAGDAARAITQYTTAIKLGPSGIETLYFFQIASQNHVVCLILNVAPPLLPYVQNLYTDRQHSCTRTVRTPT